MSALETMLETTLLGAQTGIEPQSERESVYQQPLEKDFWKAAALKHSKKLEPFVASHRYARERGEKHPIYDFLFSYYSFSRGQLLRWSPGAGVLLEADSLDELEWGTFFTKTGSHWQIDPSTFPERRSSYLEWAIKYLEGINERFPVFHCFGLHEWAMVYRSRERHHPQVSLRVSDAAIEKVVDAASMCCTHYDAFRFFTPEAVPKNKVLLTRETMMEHDQPGCIHVTMDLYKFGYKIAPYISSDLLAELFFIAVKAREIDMRASPYDLSEYGFKPVTIETKEGREEYITLQRALYGEARNLRERLISVYKVLKNA